MTIIYHHVEDLGSNPACETYPIFITLIVAIIYLVTIINKWEEHSYSSIRVRKFIPYLNIILNLLPNNYFRHFYENKHCT